MQVTMLLQVVLSEEDSPYSSLLGFLSFFPRQSTTGGLVGDIFTSVHTKSVVVSS